MKLSSKSDVRQLLERPDAPNLWVFCGQEEYLKNQLAQLVVKHFVTEEMRGTDYAEYDANFFDVAELAEHLSFFPFVGEHRVAFLKGYSPASQNAEQLEIFLDTVSDLPESAVLVVTYSNAKPAAEDSDDEKSERKKLVNKILPACEKFGAVVTPGNLGASDMVTFIRRQAGEWNVSFTKEAASLLAARCDNDMLRISNEVQRIASAFVGKEISAALIEQLLPVELEETVFRIVDNVLNGKGKTAIVQLTAALSGNHDPYMVWGALLYSFTELSKGAAAYRSGVTPSQAGEAYGGYTGKKAFVIEKNIRLASNLRKEYPQECLRILLDCDSAMKSTTGVQPQHQILRAFAEICALKRR